MTTTLDSFEALIQTAREQPEHQRLLLVFAKTVMPDDASEEQKQAFEAGQGGALMPLMYADKGEKEIVDFATLEEESRHMNDLWDIMFVGCMPGNNGLEPTSEEAEDPLRQIVETIRSGGSLAHLAAFDRQGNPMSFQ